LRNSKKVDCYALELVARDMPIQGIKMVSLSLEEALNKVSK